MTLVKDGYSAGWQKQKYEIKSGVSRIKEPRAAFEAFWPHKCLNKLI